MLPFDEYTNGWLVYVLAAIGLLWVFWRLVRPIAWRYLRQPLWLSAAVFLLTPTMTAEGHWAPAWIIGSLELLFSGIEAAKPLFTLLLVVWLATLILYLSIDVGIYFYRKKRLVSSHKPVRNTRTA